MNKLSYLLFLFVCWSCIQDSGTEIHHGKRNHVINVRDKINEIPMEDVLINNYAALFLLDNCLLIRDYRSLDNHIHIFDKNTFDYMISTAYGGQGPGEITNIGHIGINETERRFYVSDHGKQRIFSYDLDSILINPSSMPKVKLVMKEDKFLNEYQYMNDTLCIGVGIERLGGSEFTHAVSNWNMDTEEIVPMRYEHPKIEKRRIGVAVSADHGIYVEFYWHHDLITVCSLDGNLKYNIYGPKWDSQKSNKMLYFHKAVFVNDKFVISYCGDSNFIDRGRGLEGNRPTRFMVFDINGNYLRTWETGYRICDFCYDSENNRIILSMDDDIQFGYLNLDGLI